MTDEGAPLDGANGYSPLIRLLPLVAATFPKGTAFSVAASFLFVLDTLSTKGNGVRPLSHLR